MTLIEQIYIEVYKGIHFIALKANSLNAMLKPSMKLDWSGGL